MCHTNTKLRTFDRWKIKTKKLVPDLANLISKIARQLGQKFHLDGVV